MESILSKNSILHALACYSLYNWLKFNLVNRAIQVNSIYYDLS